MPTVAAAVFNPALYSGSVTFTGPLAINKVVYVSSLSPLTVAAADSSSLSTLPSVGFVTDIIGNQCLINYIGTLHGFSGLIPGVTYYVGSAGAVTATKPTNAQSVGLALNATMLVILSQSFMGSQLVGPLVGPLTISGDSVNNAVVVTSVNDVAVGLGTLPTTATAGFLYIPECAGTPTGYPLGVQDFQGAQGVQGYVPIVFNSSNNHLYAYSGAQWVQV